MTLADALKTVPKANKGNKLAGLPDQTGSWRKRVICRTMPMRTKRESPNSRIRVGTIRAYLIGWKKPKRR